MLTYILILLITACAAQAEIRYTEADLNRVRERAVPDIKAVFYEDIIGRLPRDQQARARQVKLAFPEAGRSPLDFYADPSTQTISMPLTSIRFFDDMAVLYSWFESKGCRAENIQSYLLATLRQGRTMPTPLRAFDIDRQTAFADPFAGDVSGKIYSSGLQFILAHELGHLMLDHRTDVNAAGSQRQEVEADAFALEHFARLGGNPMGVFWYYMTAWWYDPQDAIRRAASTHPVSPERINALAARLLREPMDFAHGEENPQREAVFVRQIAGMAGTLAGFVEENGMLNFMIATLHEEFPVEGFAEACPS